MIDPNIEQDWIEADARRRIDEAWRAKWRRDVALVWVVAAAFMSSLGGLTACAHRPPNLVITGDALDIAGTSFEAVQAGMESADNAHLLTRSQALAWNDFFERWRAGYHGVASLWRIDKAKQNYSAADQAGALLQGLLDELAEWQIVLLGLHPLDDGGVP